MLIKNKQLTRKTKITELLQKIYKQETHHPAHVPPLPHLSSATLVPEKQFKTTGTARTSHEQHEMA